MGFVPGYAALYAEPSNIHPRTQIRCPRLVLDLSERFRSLKPFFTLLPHWSPYLGRGS